MSELHGLTDADFNVWKHHPVSKIYLQYLSDYAALLGREFLDRWLAGHVTADTEKELRGRILTLAELVDLKFESIENFYQKPEEENATEVAKVVSET